ncbi:hypothetical protein EYF80_053074 [Liparis tanakae]|uniref:Uncharacterized protein n=1 Tax=Liparis tanakae TaxID=230148 RepID=A0A4Z2F7D9_9TELE|nr:hypothetical protein EYF80_053074 [Liparis tanakae]
MVPVAGGDTRSSASWAAGRRRRGPPDIKRPTCRPSEGKQEVKRDEKEGRAEQTLVSAVALRDETEAERLHRQLHSGASCIETSVRPCLQDGSASEGRHGDFCLSSDAELKLMRPCLDGCPCVPLLLSGPDSSIALLFAL